MFQWQYISSKAKTRTNNKHIEIGVNFIQLSLIITL